MMPVLLFIGFGLFAFGFFQWARSGDSIWKIFKLRRELRSKKGRDVEAAEKEIERLETSTDRVLRSSLRIIGLLAICTWLVVGVIFVLDLFGVNWAHTVTTHASSYWKAATPNNPFERNTNATRNEMLHKMGTGVKK